MMRALHRILFLFARMVLWKYEPDVIGITGSVGKTSTKDAVALVLSKKFSVRKSPKSYNNQLGVPFTILGVNAPGQNPLNWIALFWRALMLVIVRDSQYPQILVLEMGADRPGDIAYLTRLAPPHIGIVTSIGKDAPVHIEFFRNVDALVREKRQMVHSLTKKDIALLNADDPFVMEMKEKTRARVITLGFFQEADIFASDLVFYPEEGMHYKVHAEGNVIPMTLHALGKGQVYSSLFALAVGRIYGMNFVELEEALRHYKAPSGRLNIIEGIKNTLILDDSYNASPVATHEALDVLRMVGEEKRKLACLGDMSELGTFTEAEHKKVGRHVAEIGVEELYTVGPRAKILAEEAGKKMGQERVFIFDTAEEAERFIQNRLQKKDILLVKGSQVVRLEKVVKELMAHPEKAASLLVRQEKSWIIH